MSTIHTSFDGEDLEIEVTRFYAGRPAKIFAPAEECYPEEYPEIEFEVKTPGLEHWADSSELNQQVLEIFLSEQEQEW